LSSRPRGGSAPLRRSQSRDRFALTMTFADTLKTLPTVAHLAALQLQDAQGQLLARI